MSAFERKLGHRATSMRERALAATLTARQEEQQQKRRQRRLACRLSIILTVIVNVMLSCRFASRAFTLLPKLQSPKITSTGAPPPPLPVFCLPLGSCNNETFFDSSLLTFSNDPHQSRVSWFVHHGNGMTEDLLPLLQQSVDIRTARRNNNTIVHGHHCDEYMDPDWNIILSDTTDNGGGDWFPWFASTELVNLTGWQRLYFITRTITSHRPRRMEPASTMPQSTNLTLFLGQEKNFTIYLGTTFHTITRYYFPVRNDIFAAVQRKELALLQQSNANSTTNAITILETVHRPQDVAHFWNPNVTSNASRLRAAVSRAIQELRSSNTNISVFTDIIGHRARKGRAGIHPEYINALLKTKIVVVCQRDNWEDHWRLLEAITGGAMVLTDPMLDFPHGLVDGKSIVVYHSLQDLKENILYYLQHDKERIEIARRGRKTALEHHRMIHRWEQLVLVNNRSSSYVNENGVSHIKWPPTR